MYYYRRRSSAGSLFLWLIISLTVILIISPRARRKLGSMLERLSAYLMGFRKDIGRQVNQMGISFSDKFRIYKLADLTGAIKRTLSIRKERHIDPNELKSDIVYYDLSQDDDEDDVIIDYRKKEE